MPPIALIAPSTDETLWWAVRALFGVAIPNTRVCPDHISPFEAFADAYFARNSMLDPKSDPDQKSMVLWHGSRGLSGKSHQLSTLGLTMAFLLGADVNLLGGSLAQSTNIHEHMRAALYYKNAPRDMLEIESNNLVKLNNRARIRPLTASQKTVRGPHPPRLLLDEIDEMELAILDAALGQPMEQRNWLGEWIKPYAVLCSTWQNPEGTFTEILRRFEEDGTPILRWCYRESNAKPWGWLSDEAIAEKRRTIPKAMWEAEYELNEPSIGSRAFDTEAVDRAFSLDTKPLKEKIGKDFEEFAFEAPERNGLYVAGADWGRERDYTVIQVARVDVKPYRLVYYMRVNRRPYPQMIGWFNDAINLYHASAAHDATGLGNVVNDYTDVRARKFIMTGEKRSAMLSGYVSSIESDQWRFPKMLKKAYSEHRYCQVGDLYSSKDVFHLPDTVCSAGLMNWMAERVQPSAAPVLVTRDSQIGKLASLFERPPDSDDDRQSLLSPEGPQPGSISLLV